MPALQYAKFKYSWPMGLQGLQGIAGLQLIYRHVAVITNKKHL